MIASAFLNYRGLGQMPGLPPQSLRLCMCQIRKCFCLCFCLSLSLALSVSICLSLSISVSLCLSLCLWLCLSLSLCFSLYIEFSYVRCPGCPPPKVYAYVCVKYASVY